jgi:hypothetical protein
VRRLASAHFVPEHDRRNVGELNGLISQIHDVSQLRWQDPILDTETLPAFEWSAVRFSHRPIIAVSGDP